MDGQAMVRLAMETVQADMRAIYGKSGRSTSRVNMRGQKLVEIRAVNRQCFFRPDGSGAAVQFRQTWDLIQIFMLFYVALVVPFRIGFHVEATPSEWAFWWEVVVDLYFWVDIILNFRTGYFDVNNDLVIEQKLLCKNYLRGWFLLDLVSCTPVTYIGLIVNGGTRAEAEAVAASDLKMLKVFRLLRLAKLLRLARIKRLFARLEEQYRLLAKGSRITKIMFIILLSAHFVACAWHYVGSMEIQEIGTDRSTGTPVQMKPWVVRLYGGIGKVGGEDEVDFETGLQVSAFTRYLDALYYSVTTLTTVGYGDRVPSTDSEKVVSILCELAGCVAFGVIAGSLSAIAMTESMTRLEIKQKINQLEELMQEKNVPMTLRHELSAQLSNWFEKKSVFDEEVLLSYLPPRQRKDLLITIYKPFLINCPLMQGLEWAVMSRLCLMMRPYLAVADDIICNEGEVGEEMYLIVRGTVRLESSRFPDYNTRSWEDGAFFGELPLLDCGGSDGGNSNHHVYTARALIETDCTYITQEDFEELNAQRPTLKVTMRKHALQRAKRFGTQAAERTLSGFSTSDVLLPQSPNAGQVARKTTDSQEDDKAWFYAAKTAAPHLLQAEIESLRAEFMKYATPGRSDEQLGELVMNLDAIQAMLDNSLQEVFARLDMDDSGSLERSEIETLLSLVGVSGDLDHLMGELDGDGDGEVEFAEFKVWLERSQFGTTTTQENRIRELQDLFNAVDTDGNGEIDWAEFLHMVAAQLARELFVEQSVNHLKAGHGGKGGSVPPAERPARSATDMIRLALNTVRADTRSIYGGVHRPQTTFNLQFGPEAIAKARRCLFRPDGTGASVKFRKGWDTLQIFMLFYVALVVPFRVGFSQQMGIHDPIFWWEVLVDIYFWLDIVINFRTGYYDDRGILVIEQRMIAAKYMKGWFFLDFISCLPVMYVELIVTGGNVADGSDLIVLKSFRLLRMAKLLRLVRVKRLLARLEKEYKGIAQGGRVMKICFSILISAHFVACAWHYVGLGEEQELGYDADGTMVVKTPWVKKMYGAIEDGPCGVDELDPPTYECGEVLISTKYLDALYYSVTTLTTVGYGDRVPETNSEKVLSILCELAGSVSFGIIAGSLSAIAMSESMTRREIKSRSSKLDEFMQTKNVPKQMREEIGSQLANYFEKKSALDEKAVIACLPPKHQKDLVMAIYHPYLVDCPLLQGIERGLMSRLCLVMRPYLALAGDEITVEGEVGEEMYLITRGVVKLQSTKYPAYNTRLWEDGAFFGELPLLDCGAEETDSMNNAHGGAPTVSVNGSKRAKEGAARRTLHVYTAKALMDSHCTYVTRPDLDELNAKRPELKQTMRKFAMQRAVRFGMEMDEMQEAADNSLLRDAKSGPSGILELVEAARVQIEEAREGCSLDSVDEGTKASIEKFCKVDEQLDLIQTAVLRMVNQRARAKTGISA